MSVPTSYGNRARRLAAYLAANYTAGTLLGTPYCWLRADTTTNAGGFVSQFTDKSGNGRHFVQATGTKQPALTSTDALMGNQASATFDGIDDAVTYAAGFGASNAYTQFLVTRSMVAGGSQRFVSIGNVADPQSLYIGPASATDSRPTGFFQNPGSTATQRRSDMAGTSSYYQAAQPAITCIVYDSTQTAANAFVARARLGEPNALNSGSLATPAGVANLATAIGGAKAGTSLYGNFTFAEYIAFAAVLTAEQMASMELLLARYYGLL